MKRQWIDCNPGDTPLICKAGLILRMERGGRQISRLQLLQVQRFSFYERQAQINARIVEGFLRLIPLGGEELPEDTPMPVPLLGPRYRIHFPDGAIGYLYGR